MEGKNPFYHGRLARTLASTLMVGVTVWFLPSCASPRAASGHGPQSGAAAEAPGPYVWQPETRSPRAAEPPSADLGAPCRRGDAALEAVASLVAERELAGSPVELTELGFALRAAGSPYVWPHLYTLAGTPGLPEAAERVPAWLASIEEGGELRCGITRRGDTREVLAAVAVSVLADLDPLPTHVRQGAWLDVSARLLVPAEHASVLVLGPSGAPRSVPASLGDGRVRARFSADRDGAFLVQVLATVSGGPRPVAEAVVHAGSKPPTRYASTPAPGEDAALDADPAASLRAMIDAARRAEGVPRVRRSEALERLAAEHATAMRDARRLAHDAGHGTPAERAARAGVNAKVLGENVAHALDATRAHRTLWASPSHRKNLLDPRFDSLGVGAAVDEDGTLWVAELFARLD